LLAPLEITAQHASAATYAPLGRPAEQGLAVNYANIHRDWCWGAVENAATLAAVRRALGHHALGRTLVLGAGAGRLAYDLHQSEGATKTYAVDAHPLLMLVARRMFDGSRLQLYEFPIAPRDLASHALLRSLGAPAPARAGLQLVFAEARYLPFDDDTFDTVVTPWSADVIDADLSELAGIINRVLVAGGRWISTGALSFDQRCDATRCYATEEIAEVIEAAGFTVPEFDAQVVPFLASPASRQSRRQEVATFAVTKWKSVLARQSGTPCWREDLRSPVPRLPEVDAYMLALRIEAYVASMVDGQRSVADIAARLVEERLLLPQGAIGLVRDFLVRLQEEAGH
jgi:ubiquinone/menaquinone biosynthesis C-methylase UbiE